ncbi:hypothetical protein BBP40_002178 [Aspergillus hancockii]|nr:hypothetical protein BBP40_002178 [Aspergillus hancockii]
MDHTTYGSAGRGNNRDYTEPEIARYAEDEEYSLKTRKSMEKTFNGMYHAFMKGSSEKQALRVQLDFEAGCRRLNPGEPDLKALQETNARPLFDPIEEITPSGIRAGGQERQVNAIILATGFNTSFPSRFPIIGPQGRDLRDV